ncbi:alpha/beta fold hydrolase [Kribbella sp. NPDC004536]|uniref:alpha/beta fold hydrolase n=1 Tax=Kribbella sp. NPDC004536 TaxID=3364106 RepID=UPI00369A4FCF
MPPSRSTTTSRDGTRLAVYTYANPGAHVLICVHGYPDNASLWSSVAEQLSEDFHVVTYDVRGAGESDHPSRTSAYSLDRLQEDFEAILNQVSPNGSVHVLAHDWGSIQAWQPVTAPELQDRIASFTSISGPSLDHAGYFIRRRNRAAFKQLLHSWYIYYFHLPWIPELAWRKGWAQRAFNRLEPQDPNDNRNIGDYVNGIKLYRANVLRRLIRPAECRTEIPVLAVAPDADPFVTTPLQTEIERWAPNLTVKLVRGGHWLPRKNPGLVAELVREHTRQVARWET